MCWSSISLVSILVLQAATAPPPRAAFEGTWRLDATRSASAAADSPDEPVLVEIIRTDRDITLVTTQGARQRRSVHGLVAAPGAPYGIDGTAGRAYWVGEALVTEGTGLVQGQTVAMRETRTLSPDGNEMFVDLVVIVQHGYAVRGGKNYGIGRDVYTRVR